MIFVFKGYTVVYPLAIFSWSQHHRAFISRNIQPSNKPNMLCIYIYFYLVCSVAVKRYEHDEKLEAAAVPLLPGATVRQVKCFHLLSQCAIVSECGHCVVEIPQNLFLSTLPGVSMCVLPKMSKALFRAGVCQGLFALSYCRNMVVQHCGLRVDEDPLPL